MRINSAPALLFFCCAGLTSPLWAAETGSDAGQSQIQAQGSASCVDVVVNGERIPSYQCLTQKLAPKENSKPSPSPEMTSQSIVGKPSNQLGLFNYAATSNRMGNTFGTSVYPQRPPATPAVPVLPR